MNYTDIAIEALKKIRAQRTEVDRLWQDEEIVRQFNKNGYVLLWSDVLKDYVAYYSTDEDLKKVPPCFIPYSYEELVQINNNELSEHSLRMIHTVKKMTRFDVTDIRGET